MFILTGLFGQNAKHLLEFYYRNWVPQLNSIKKAQKTCPDWFAVARYVIMPDRANDTVWFGSRITDGHVMTARYAQDFGPFDGKLWLNCAHQGAIPRMAADAAAEAV